ncbi:MAG TPA: hypothetical protein PLI45_03425 [Candidatus Woesebacteria bacterium]|nr:hypothetical protein [Candidatus Woesebacteria bacterium]
MPASIVNYSWSKDFSAGMSAKKWQDGIRGKIATMDDDEFDLFLAGVVMASAKEQIMGKDLTEKIEFFRTLRS